MAATKPKHRVPVPSAAPSAVPPFSVARPLPSHQIDCVLHQSLQRGEPVLHPAGRIDDEGGPADFNLPRPGPGATLRGIHGPALDCGGGSRPRLPVVPMRYVSAIALLVGLAGAAGAQEPPMRAYPGERLVSLSRRPPAARDLAVTGALSPHQVHRVLGQSVEHREPVLQAAGAAGEIQDEGGAARTPAKARTMCTLAEDLRILGSVALEISN